VGAESFTDFYRQHYRLILTVAQQRLGGHSDAEDITAEVFRIAWMHDADGHELTLRWAYQVLRNVIGNEYRRVARGAKLTDRTSAAFLEHLVESATDDALAVRRAIEDLPPDDREMLSMAYWEDLTGQEIASILGCSAVTARVRLLRARRKLKTLLNSEDFVSEGTDHGRP